MVSPVLLIGFKILVTMTKTTQQNTSIGNKILEICQTVSQ